MTTMNNEDPADPSVHEPRELPEPLYTADQMRDAIERACARGYAAGKRRSRIEIALIAVASSAVYMWLRS